MIGPRAETDINWNLHVMAMEDGTGDLSIKWYHSFAGKNNRATTTDHGLEM